MGAQYWSQTATGGRFCYDDPASSDFSMIDIIHQLSHISRFGGACTYFYSVAQHSIALGVYYITRGNARDPESIQIAAQNALYALFHDAAEAYLGDIRTPMKNMIPGFRELEAQVNAALFDWLRNDQKLPLPDQPPEDLATIDRRIVNNERRLVMFTSNHEWSSLDGELGKELDIPDYFFGPAEPYHTMQIFAQILDMLIPAAAGLTQPKPDNVIVFPEQTRTH